MNCFINNKLQLNLSDPFESFNENELFTFNDNHNNALLEIEKENPFINDVQISKGKQKLSFQTNIKEIKIKFKAIFSKSKSLKLKKVQQNINFSKPNAVFKRLDIKYSNLEIQYKNQVRHILEFIIPENYYQDDLLHILLQGENSIGNCSFYLNTLTNKIILGGFGYSRNESEKFGFMGIGLESKDDNNYKLIEYVYNDLESISFYESSYTFLPNKRRYDFIVVDSVFHYLFVCLKHIGFFPNAIIVPSYSEECLINIANIGIDYIFSKNIDNSIKIGIFLKQTDFCVQKENRDRLEAIIKDTILKQSQISEDKIQEVADKILFCFY